MVYDLLHLLCDHASPALDSSESILELSHDQRNQIHLSDQHFTDRSCRGLSRSENDGALKAWPKDEFILWIPGFVHSLLRLACSRTRYETSTFCCFFHRQICKYSSYYCNFYAR